MRVPIVISAIVCGLVAGIAPRVSASADRMLPSNATEGDSGIDAANFRGLPGAGSLLVQGHFGGRIFGFDIDQYGADGLLSEALTQQDGTLMVAVETFNQRTGEIISIVSHMQTETDDYLTLGVVGPHVGLVELEHEDSFLHLVRTFPVLDPLSSGRLTQRWTPPIDEDHIIESVSRNQDSSTVAVYAYDNSDNFRPQIFSSNVSLNTFGPLITLTDESFQTGLIPKLAYNDRTGNALLGIQTIGNAFIPPTFALVDLRGGGTRIFSGVGLGDVNGLAIDPTTNIACSTTEIDFSVEFYTLATLDGFSESLPGATNQLFSGADVAVDTLHHLFLVAQPVSSTAPGTSSIHVYDENGNLVESLDGFHFSNAGNVVPMHIALHPNQRRGFVDGPDPGVTQIQAFAY